MTILITGGAGYIGSHMVYAAQEIDEEVVVIDNLSTGVRALVPERTHGFSVREVIDVVSKIAGHRFPTRDAPPRQGDMVEVVADPTKLMQTLNWRPCHNDLQQIVTTAYEWERHLNGS